MERLFISGILGSGLPNENVMKKIGETWKAWRIKGHVFVSEKLSHHWQALDDFEGAECQRR